VIGSTASAPDDMTVHKATRECPMTEPHRREICGLVKAREARQGSGPAPVTKP
jgi:hypothetical protein